ncbi:MAG: hypothetical protein LBL66_06725, partial [Clostridiales bacterium]|nr:hypothetical protein [Clostridiales bacterium]
MTAARKKLTAIIAFAMAGVMLLGGTGMIIGGIAGKNGGGAATPVFLAPDPLGDRPDFDPAVLVNPIDKTARAENGFSYSGDAGAKTIKITGGRYTASIRYDKKFLIDSMSVDGETVLGLDNGIYTSHKADGTVYTSLSLAADPAVHIDETNLEFGAVYFTFTYDDGIAVVQARVTARKESMALRLNRKFKTAATLSSQSFPMLKVEQDFTESIRWLESGSNFWVSGEGDDLERFLSAKRFKADKNLKRAMDEINFALLTGIEKRVALRVSGGTADAVPTPANANKRIPRQYSTEADRAPLENGKRHLTLNVNMPKAGTNLKFGTGDADWGWQTGGGDYTGSIRPTGSETVFAPVSFAASDENTLTLTFAPADWEDFFDLGELYGIDEANAAQAINSFARLAVIGKDVGTTLEYPHYFIELPPIQQQWNASLVSIFGDDAGMEAQKWSLRNIKNYIQKANGHMKSPYPGVPYDSWGHDYADMQLGYVTAIKNVYSYSGDKGFALEFKDSAERSLQYMFETYFDDEAKLATNVYKANPSDNPDKAYLTESHNDYWEKSVGEYNAYLTAHYYEALVSLAQLERYVYGDTVKADGYETLAAEIKTAFNKDKADGGCWVPGMQAYYYGTDNFDFAYLPVQAVAMRTGLADGARAVTLANKIEREQGSYN